jgi:hypothetical protein
MLVHGFHQNMQDGMSWGKAQHVSLWLSFALWLGRSHGIALSGLHPVAGWSLPALLIVLAWA